MAFIHSFFATCCTVSSCSTFSGTFHPSRFISVNVIEISRWSNDDLGRIEDVNHWLVVVVELIKSISPSSVYRSDVLMDPDDDDDQSTLQLKNY